MSVATMRHEDYDALDATAWGLYVVPRVGLSGLGQYSVGLATVRSLAGGPVAYSGLGARIDGVNHSD